MILLLFLAQFCDLAVMGRIIHSPPVEPLGFTPAERGPLRRDTRKKKADEVGVKNQPFLWAAQ